MLNIDLDINEFNIKLLIFIIFYDNIEEFQQVFERGLKAIPFSVDLWIHYINYCKATFSDNEELLRNTFEKALEACGLEFRFSI